MHLALTWQGAKNLADGPKWPGFDPGNVNWKINSLFMMATHS